MVHVECERLKSSVFTTQVSIILLLEALQVRDRQTTLIMGYLCIFLPYNDFFAVNLSTQNYISLPEGPVHRIVTDRQNPIVGVGKTVW